MMMLDIPILNNDEVSGYFNKKSHELLDALDKNILPVVCNSYDNWNWKRCKGFCEVAEFCPEGSKIKKVHYISNVYG